MSTVLIAGSPSERSRSAGLLEVAGRRLAARGERVDQVHIRSLSPSALVLADPSHPTTANALNQVARARVLVVATPVYKAAYSGLLKVFLDLLPQTALKDKIVLPLATGGSPHHALALDYTLRPVLQLLGARSVLRGIYATDSQISLRTEGGCDLHDEIARRLDEAIDVLLSESRHSAVAHAESFEALQFAQA